MIRDFWLRAAVATLLFGPSPALAQRPQVLDPTIPSGTIVLLDPGHPTLPGVTTQLVEDTFVIEGTLYAAPGAFDLSTPSYQLCQSPGVNCAQFETRFPPGHVIASRFTFEVRERGSEIWTRLEQKRKLMVLRPDNTFADTGAFPNEYEEFHGFSISPIFATTNCAVRGREENAWEVRLWRLRPVDFRISIPLARCSELEEADDPAQ